MTVELFICPCSVVDSLVIRRWFTTLSSKQTKATFILLGSLKRTFCMECDWYSISTRYFWKSKLTGLYLEQSLKLCDCCKAESNAHGLLVLVSVLWDFFVSFRSKLKNADAIMDDQSNQIAKLQEEIKSLKLRCGDSGSICKYDLLLLSSAHIL